MHRNTSSNPESRRTLVSPFRRNNKVGPNPVAAPPTTTEFKGDTVEPVYSKVIKVKKDTSSVTVEAEENCTENPIKGMPTLESYEQGTTDRSVVIANDSTRIETGLVPPPVPPYKPDEESEAAIYEEVGAPGESTAMKSSINDVANVHLTSIRGTYDFLQSPSGTSVDMEAIHSAAAYGNKRALSEILSQLPVTNNEDGSSDYMCVRQGIDKRDGKGRTALMHAVHNNHTQCVRLLAKQGANVNAVSDDGSTVVHHAAYSSNVEMLALLLSLGANGVLRDNDGRTPLHWCTNNLNPETMRTLIDKVPNLDVNVTDAALMTPLMWAAFHCKAENIELLKVNGADQCLIDVDGMTALHWSIQRHDTSALQVLLNLEISKFSDHKGKTIMHQAAEQGCAKAVALIEAVRPTSVNDIDNKGRTPLHWATVCENTGVIKALLAFGAHTRVKDFSGYTALDYANEKKLHYCGLLLTQAEEFADKGNTSASSYLTCDSTPTIPQSQLEGRSLQLDNGSQSLSPGQLGQLRAICAGAWIHKFTNCGKGPLHRRLFWVEPETKMICWTKANNKFSKDSRKELLVGVRSSASPAVVARKDFDPMHLHKYTFTILTAKRVLDVVAVSSEDYKIWLNGLQLVLDSGGANVQQIY